MCANECHRRRIDVNFSSYTTIQFLWAENTFFYDRVRRFETKTYQKSENLSEHNCS